MASEATVQQQYEKMRRENRLPCHLSAVVESIGKDGLVRDTAAECITISRRGACVVTTLEVEAGQKLSVSLPSINPDRRELMSVAWVREVDGERQIGLGPIDEDTFIIFSEAAVLEAPTAQPEAPAESE